MSQKSTSESLPDNKDGKTPTTFAPRPSVTPTGTGTPGNKPEAKKEAAVRQVTSLLNTLQNVTLG